MYSQDEKDKMAMNNATIDKFASRGDGEKLNRGDRMVARGERKIERAERKIERANKLIDKGTKYSNAAKVSGTLSGGFGEAAKPKGFAEAVKAAPKGAIKGGPMEYAKGVVNSMGLTDAEKKAAEESLKKKNK